MPWTDGSKVNADATVAGRLARSAAWLWLVGLGSAAVLAGRTWSVLGRFNGEDPEIFYFAARQRGLAPLLEPFGGYVHVVPRIVAWLATGVAVEDVAVTIRVVVLGCWLLTAVCAAWACMDLTGDRSVGAAAAAGIVLVPIGSESALGVLANVHFPLLVLVAVLIVRFGETHRGAIAVAVTVLFVGLSDPLAATLVLAAAAIDPTRWLRDRRAWSVIAAACAALAVQVPTYLSTAGGRHERNPLLPWAGMSRLWLVSWLLPPTVALACIAVLRTRRGSASARLAWRCGWLTLYLAVVSHVLGGLADRYWVAPSALAVVTATATVRSHVGAGRRAVRSAGLVIGVAYAALAVGAFAPRQFLRDGLAWREAVVAARAECAATGAATVRIDTVGGAIDAAPCALFDD